MADARRGKPASEYLASPGHIRQHRQEESNRFTTCCTKCLRRSPKLPDESIELTMPKPSRRNAIYDDGKHPNRIVKHFLSKSVEATGRQWNFFWQGRGAGRFEIRQKLVDYVITLA